MVKLNSTMQSRRLSRKRGKSLERSNGTEKRREKEKCGGCGSGAGAGAGALNEKEERRWRTKHGYRGTLSLEFHSEKLLLLGAERGPNINRLMLERPTYENVEDSWGIEKCSSRGICICRIDVSSSCSDPIRSDGGQKIQRTKTLKIREDTEETL